MMFLIVRLFSSKLIHNITYSCYFFAERDDFIYSVGLQNRGPLKLVHDTGTFLIFIPWQNCKDVFLWPYLFSGKETT